MEITKKILILIIILTMLCTTTVFAMFITQSETTISKKVAKPIIELVQTSDSISIDYWNTDTLYEFSVRNYNDSGEVSDVQIRYYVQIIANNFNYIKDFKFKKKTGSSYRNQTINYNSSTPMYYSDYYYLPAGTKQEDKFRLTMEYQNGNYYASTGFWVRIYADQVAPVES